MPATLNPKWNAQFNFLVPLPLTDTVKISVWDKDLMKDELIGRNNIPLKDLPLIKGMKFDQTNPVSVLRPLYTVCGAPQNTAAMN